MTRRNDPRRLFSGGEARSDRGFTILEILIASAIMAVGMVMILGLFPFGIRVGKQVVEDTTGIAIARSVADSIRFGMRNNLRKNSVRDGTTFSYFVFQHDGVKDPVPLDQRAEDVSHDYYILLPIYPRGSSFEGGNEVQQRDKAMDVSQTFVYPESDRPDTSGAVPNGGGDPRQADNDGDDYLIDGEYETIFVSDVYQLGDNFYDSYDRDGQGVARPRSDREQLADLDNEILKQYSFAFAIRPSYFDTDLAEAPGIFAPGNELYHVRVMIFRAFEQNIGRGEDGGKLRPVEPVFELDFEVSI